MSPEVSWVVDFHTIHVLVDGKSNHFLCKIKLEYIYIYIYINTHIHTYT